ncbi:MAG: hypothetical protein E2591_11295 [Achromobacter sp.]|uniref:HAD family hydrolase n=1 Tax=Achromobacter sp. TaxID=134375 RepID=UPI0012C9D2D3|nr:HAD-IA family hydrolase [Achromobacter sp.]MPS78650.1 hypothetical protein [Achromobacter sp.]
MALKAVAFDAFGTLVYIGERRSPYRQLMRWAQEHGRTRRIPRACAQTWQYRMERQGRELLPMLNAYAMSYDAGAVKPQPRIYQFLLKKLGCIADEVLFVGDTVVADLEEPRAFGMQACLLNRSAGQALADVVLADLLVGGSLRNT